VLDERAKDRDVHIHQGTACKSGRCALKAVELTGRSAVCPVFRTHGEAIRPDRTAEVSRGRSRNASAEGPISLRKGLMGARSKRRDL
jgi:hypothetical protein